jgi:hypothetical protein
MMPGAVVDSALPNIAFYYPGPMWRASDYLKNLLLFFDGIALLVPEYMRDRPYEMDPSLVAGLQEHDLLHILEPESLMDREAAEALATSLGDVIASGALDDLPNPDRVYEELSMSRMGWVADAGLAGMLIEELEARSLARPSQDGVSIPMHPFVRNLVLVLLAQLLRPAGRRAGFDLCPATDRPSLHTGLTELLQLPALETEAHVVDLDLQVVGVNLASVPLDEVLEFRSEHASSYGTYARDVRKLMRELASIPAQERDGALDDRAAEIAERARRLQDASRRWWKRPAGVVLGLAGAAWTVTTGDILGGLLAGGAGGLTALPEGSADAEAFSYLFQTTELFY